MNIQTTRNGHQVARVRDKATGRTYTIRAHGFDADKHEPLEFDAVDRNGYPLPPKFRVAKATTKATMATKATTTKAPEATTEAKKEAKS